MSDQLGYVDPNGPEPIGKDFMELTEDDGYPGGWFGDSWGAPVCDPEDHHRATPVGQECDDCHVPIVEGDQGLLIPGSYLIDGEITYKVAPMHIACFRRERL